ncbi:hypothetical protein U1Q18_048596, partial [Sarracenia purpurea var. burkii]
GVASGEEIMNKFQTKRVLSNRIQDTTTKSAKAGFKSSNRFHSLVSPNSDEYEVSFPSLPPRKELSTPKELKKQAIDPPSHRSIIEEALRIHDNLEALIRDNPLEVKLSEVFRAEKKSLEADIEAYSICPDSLLFEKIEAIDARTQKIKELTLEVETGILKTLGSEAKIGTARVEAKGNTESIDPETEYIEEDVSEVGREVPGTDVSPGAKGFNSTVTVSKVSAPVYGPNGLAIVVSCEIGVICMNYEGEGKQLGEYPSDRSLAHQVLDKMTELNSVKVRGEEESSLELEGSEREIESGEVEQNEQGSAAPQTQVCSDIDMLCKNCDSDVVDDMILESVGKEDNKLNQLLLNEESPGHARYMFDELPQPYSKRKTGSGAEGQVVAEEARGADASGGLGKLADNGKWKQVVDFGGDASVGDVPNPALHMLDKMPQPVAVEIKRRGRVEMRWM